MRNCISLADKYRAFLMYSAEILGLMTFDGLDGGSSATASRCLHCIALREHRAPEHVFETKSTCVIKGGPRAIVLTANSVLVPLSDTNGSLACSSMLCCSSRCLLREARLKVFPQ